MTEARKTTMTKYLIGAGVVAAIWFVLSFVLGLMLAGAEDNPDMAATTPRPLKLACAIAFFPMRYLQQWDRRSVGMGEHGMVFSVLLGMLINALLWGFLIVFLYRLAARLFAIK